MGYIMRLNDNLSLFRKDLETFFFLIPKLVERSVCVQLVEEHLKKQ